MGDPARERGRRADQAAISDPSCERRCDRTRNTREREERDSGLRQAEIRACEPKRRGCPEQAEGAELARLVEGASPQERRRHHHLAHRGQELAIAELRRRGALR